MGDPPGPDQPGNTTPPKDAFQAWADDQAAAEDLDIFTSDQIANAPVTEKILRAQLQSDRMRLDGVERGLKDGNFVDPKDGLRQLEAAKKRLSATEAQLNALVASQTAAMTAGMDEASDDVDLMHSMLPGAGPKPPEPDPFAGAKPEAGTAAAAPVVDPMAGAAAEGSGGAVESAPPVTPVIAIDAPAGGGIPRPVVAALVGAAVIAAAIGGGILLNGGHSKGNGTGSTAAARPSPTGPLAQFAGHWTLTSGLDDQNDGDQTGLHDTDKTLKSNPTTASFDIDGSGRISGGDYHASYITNTPHCSWTVKFDSSHATGGVYPNGQGEVQFSGSRTETWAGPTSDCVPSTKSTSNQDTLWYVIDGSTMYMCYFIGDGFDWSKDKLIQCVEPITHEGETFVGKFHRT